MARIKLKPLAQQTIVITGASSGIGLATARLVARAGAAVFAIARNENALSRLVAEIEASGGKAAYAVADVADQPALEAASAKAIERFGGFDTWVTVAGVAIYAPLLDTPRDEHERMFRTNYWGVVNACGIAVEHLRKKGGALITVGSVVSDIGTPVLGAYAASKHAAKGFIDSLRIELLADKAPISVTLIKPSGIGTPLIDHAANHVGKGAKAPPPAYSPDIVAEAIAHAAVHPTRELTIGGVGALQILGHTLAPSLVDWVSTLILPLLTDSNRPPPATSNLFAPSAGGEERSPNQRMLPNSLYTAAARRRWIAAGLVGLSAVWSAKILKDRADRRAASGTGIVRPDRRVWRGR